MAASWSRLSPSSGPCRALAASGPGQRVLLHLVREPFPLYQALASNGFAWQTERSADGSVDVLMWRE